MGCRLSKHLDAYEDRGMALTTKTFSLGDPKSILNSPTSLAQHQQAYNLPKRILEEYQVIRQISEGETSRIFLVRKKHKGEQRPVEASVSSTEEGYELGDDDTIAPIQQFVLQQIDLTSMSESKRRGMTKEIQLIQDTKHPNSTFDDPFLSLLTPIHSFAHSRFIRRWPFVVSRDRVVYWRRFETSLSSERKRRQASDPTITVGHGVYACRRTVRTRSLHRKQYVLVDNSCSSLTLHQSCTRTRGTRPFRLPTLDWRGKQWRAR